MKHCKQCGHVWDGVESACPKCLSENIATINEDGGKER